MAISSSSQYSVADEVFSLAADAVRDTNSTEGALRSAISRAYYAVFLTVRDQLFGPDGTALSRATENKLRDKFQKANKNKSTPGRHETYIFALTDIRPRRGLNPVTLLQQVDQLKEAREHADYHFTSGSLEAIPQSSWYEYARENVELAGQLLPMVRKLPRY